MRIALVCEPEFEKQHVGVRAFFLTILKAAQEMGAKVDILVNHKHSPGNQWTTVRLSERAISSNMAEDDSSISGSPLEVYYKYKHNYVVNDKAPFDRQNERTVFGLGSRLPESVYDLAIVTAPWLADGERFPARRVVGIVYDTVPNSYALNGKLTGAFAYQHAVGFAHFTRTTDEVWAISAHTRSAFLEYCEISKLTAPPVQVLPLTIPYHLSSTLTYAEGAGAVSRVRKPEVVAVGLFDWRKGLADAPTILNGVSTEFSLTICGGVRCGPEAVADFFRKLKVDRLTWHPTVRSETLAQIYSRASLLIFNSDAEGLGLPVIEAQTFGCPALTSDHPAILEGALAGSVALPRTASKPFSDAIDHILATELDHVDLAERARARFSPGHLVKAIAEAIPPSA